MKRARDDDGESPPPAKRPALHAPNPEVELALAKQRARFLEERAKLERRVHEAEKRALCAEMEKSALAERSELEKRALTAELEKRVLTAEHEKRGLAAELEKRALETKHKHIAALLEEQDRQGEKSEEPQPKQPTAHEFHWLRTRGFIFRLPTDLFTHLTTFLPDNQLFNLRGVSLAMYRAFYNQSGARGRGKEFNSLRAIRLAKMGRVFPRLKALFCGPEELGLVDADLLTGEELAAIGPRHFPKLESLNMDISKRAALRCLPSNPGLTNLETIVASSEDRFTTERFPALKSLSLNIFKENARVEPHAGLLKLELWFKPEDLDELMESFQWSLITRKAFPSLKTLIQANVPEEQKTRLAAEGFDIIDPN